MPKKKKNLTFISGRCMDQRAAAVQSAARKVSSSWTPSPTSSSSPMSTVRFALILVLVLMLIRTTGTKTAEARNAFGRRIHGLPKREMHQVRSKQAENDVTSPPN